MGSFPSNRSSEVVSDKAGQWYPSSVVVPVTGGLSRPLKADVKPGSLHRTISDVEMEMNKQFIKNGGCLVASSSESESCTSPSKARAGMSKRIGDYSVKPKRVLGLGKENTVVVEGKHNVTGRLCAAKVLPVGASARSEVNAHRCLKHPNIVELIDVHEADEDVTMLMELCSGGELHDLLDKKGPVAEAEAVRIIRQLLLAVAHIHEHGYVHMDLKLENVLLSSQEDDATIKVIDFGLCQANGALTSMRGTLGYIAPEVYQGSYTNKCDLFSVGVIAYMLLSNRSPFGQDSKTEAKALEGKVPFGPAFNGVSLHAQNFLRGLLERDPERRMSAVEALFDPWLTTEILPKVPEIDSSLKYLDLQNSSFDDDASTYATSRSSLSFGGDSSPLEKKSSGGSWTSSKSLSTWA